MAFSSFHKSLEAQAAFGGLRKFHDLKVRLSPRAATVL
jgi:hypothetical protein